MISFLYWYSTHFFIGHTTSSEICHKFPRFFVFSKPRIARARRASAICSLFKNYECLLIPNILYKNNHVTSISFTNDLIFERASSDNAETKKRWNTYKYVSSKPCKHCALGQINVLSQRTKFLAFLSFLSY